VSEDRTLLTPEALVATVREAMTPALAAALRPRLAYRIDELPHVLSLGPGVVERAVGSGHLKTFLVGRQRMVSHAALAKFIEKGERVGWLDVYQRGVLPKVTREGGAVSGHASAAARRKRIAAKK
jgi:hypothetical protein